jgi:hypothetical protein
VSTHDAALRRGQGPTLSANLRSQPASHEHAHGRSAIDLRSDAGRPQLPFLPAFSHRWHRDSLTKPASHDIISHFSLRADRIHGACPDRRGVGYSVSPRCGAKGIHEGALACVRPQSYVKPLSLTLISI